MPRITASSPAHVARPVTAGVRPAAASRATAVPAQVSKKARDLVGTGASRVASRGNNQAALQSLGMVGTKTKSRPVDPFWTQTEPLLVGPATNRRELTFSHDSEVPMHNVVRFLRSDPTMAARFDTLLANSYNDVPRQQLEKLFGLSAKQVDAFVIRRGVPVQGDSVSLQHINPRYLKSAILWEGPNARVWKLTEAIAALTVELLKERAGLDAGVSLDDFDVELKHASCESSPKAFYTHMQTLHAAVEQPNSHLHLGIPATIQAEKARFIAAAVEAKITLQRLAVTPESEARLPFKASVFNSYANGNRGIIKFQSDAFMNPWPAHDLEIRQWLDVDHGMDLLAMVAKMAQKPERLGHHNGLNSTSVSPYYGAVGASLGFVARQIEKAPNSAFKTLLPKLKSLAEQGEHDVSPAYLEKVHAMLVETQLADLICAETFLVY